ncbi:MAG: mechanosensitive ion channel family protein, partial [Hyphomicrobiales bacterium]|nr:mechanosensitive ion channel family protein [Hyphomicrobiales bacterium]
MKPASALHLLRWVVLAFALVALGRAGAQESQQLNLDETRATLTGTETALRDKNLDDSGLQSLRTQSDALALALQGAIADLTPRLAASAQRLDELTPKSGQPAPTTDVAAKDLANEKQRHDRLDANLRAARAMLLEANDLSTRISEARRQLFAQQTFARASSLLNPALWKAVWRELPVDVEVIGNLVDNWLGAFAGRPTLAEKIGMAAIVIALALAAAPLSWVARRFIYLDLGETRPSRLRRALAAAWTFAIYAALPLAALGVLAGALDSFNLSDRSTQAFIDAVFAGIRVLIAVNALGRGMLAPQRAAWRLVPVSDRTAGILYRLAMALAAIWAVERLVEPVADAAASLNLAVATRGIGAVIGAIAMFHALRGLRVQPAGAQGPPPNEPWAPLRTLGWAAALIIFLAAVTGYVAFATFLVNQATYLSIVGAALTIADIIAQDGTEAILKPDTPIGSRLIAMAGLRRNVLAQICVTLQGAARLIVVLLAFAAVLKPWGVQSQDMFGSLRAAYFGFSIGGVTLSLSSIIGAAIVFAVAVFFTRLVQDWLGSRFLPQTRLDAGARNSVRTIFGYVGVIVAALMAGAQIGLDVQKIALIAGGLSVGIGFGLQTIANNFVSGLILLWERTIRVGDWVVVGSDQGFVRAINARATEIETFDRGSLIVPNSNFVSGVVKNWVHNDRVGRIVVSVNIAYESDVDQVRDLMIAAAKAQDQVLAIPAPTVLFAEFGDWAIKFNLICFVDDIERAERTRSDVHFEILRRMREAGLRIAYPA